MTMTYTPRASLNLIGVVDYLGLAVLGWIALLAGANWAQLGAGDPQA